MSKKSKRSMAVSNDARYRNHLAGETNLVDQDGPAQVTRDPEMKVLKEVNDLEGLRHENCA